MEDLRKESIKNVEEKKQLIYKPSIFNKIKNYTIKKYKYVILGIIIATIFSFPYQTGEFVGYIIKNIYDGFVSNYI